MSLGKKWPILAATTLVLAGVAGPARADIIIDKFDDNDAVATWDGPQFGHQWGDPLFVWPAGATRMRTILDSIGISDGFGDVTDGRIHATNQLRLPDGSNGGQGMTNSPRVNPGERFEAIFTSCWRNPESAAPTFDARDIYFIRFTAHMSAPAVRSYVQPGTLFSVALTSPGRLPQVPFTSDGPFADPDGAGPEPYQLVGVPITTTPTAFVVSLTDFKTDEILKAAVEAISGPGFIEVAERGQINGIHFGFRREGNYPVDPVNPDLFCPPDFFVDDVVLSTRRPRIAATMPDNILDEAVPGDTIPVYVVLDAMPTGDVILTPASGDSLPRHNLRRPAHVHARELVTSQTFNVTVVDDLLDNGNGYFDISYATTTTDFFYQQNPPAAAAIAVLDNDATPDPTPTATPAPSSFAAGDFDNSGCTNLADFLIMLDNWQTVYQDIFMDVDDFLALLDNWQAGDGC